MAKYDISETDYAVHGARIGIVAARFNQAIVDQLLDGALGELERHKIEGPSVTVVRVPGAFEIPLAARVLAANRDVDAVITLGVVIRGETPHFDYICSECARGVAQVGLELSLPVIWGVLTADTTDQAAARAGGERGNKGIESARAALEMLTLLKRLIG